MTPSSSATERAAACRADGGSADPGDVAVGRAFAGALARRDFEAVAALLHPEIDFRALTPRRAWEPGTPSEVVELVRLWFGTAEIDQVLSIDSGAVADRLRVGYRFRGRRDGEAFVIEQQAYYAVEDARLSWVRLVCSGFRPSQA
jgi:hypothetical protein